MARWFVWLPVVLVIAALLGAVLALGFYVFTFHGTTLSDNPQQWGDFGSYVGGTIGPLVGLMNLAIVLYIAVSVISFQKSQERNLEERARKTSVAFEMHREFNAESMLRVRTDAGKLAFKGSYHTLDKLDQSTHPDAAKLWTVIHFYDRLSLAVTHRQIDKDLVPDLFGDTFVWWYRHCFKDQLQPTGWESWLRIDDLMKWLKENTRPEEFKRWEDRASKL